MEIDKWVGSYRVRAFPWIDAENIYFNVRYYAPGQRLVFDFTHTLVEHVSKIKIPEDGKVLIEAATTQA